MNGNKKSTNLCGIIRENRGKSYGAIALDLERNVKNEEKENVYIFGGSYSISFAGCVFLL